MLNLLGEYEVRLDAKGRLVLPAGLKKQLESALSKGFVVNRDVFQPCLVLYPHAVWDQTSRMLGRLNRFVEKNMEFIRRFTSGATHLELDGSGRLLLPKALMDDPKLGKDLKLVCLGDRVEVWSKEGYARMRREKVNLSALAEEVMGSLGNDDGPSHIP
ncbi:MAG TPA: division/cell wall cluster transcriptional repressor MraZ [Flavobacteriales bacterium]|nr:division/cell wall cluster transcriptional repressor MraZ [Flavobacteriales bacterium]HRN36065.1 division/cell wall cluster transcriptional repressor MraZ [Flavobacteriales bacterium]HRO40090.1 division/cell wall cluster transcriptional repressor MraZ [Flavobacteriales bacterium]HRP80793.1 division/cell wall cluster transcriptional repressor MraZ [Flavobacteriales bacterium]HRQ85214.1 division/cell wall cluster transcriptional repressor MraZ [Flavobacteriales bacterium]